MTNMVTDVTPILMQAFPNLKPEMSASDFDRAHKFVVGRKNGTVPRPGPLAMDYPWWAHCMIVDWRMRVDEFEKTQSHLKAMSVWVPAPTKPPGDLRCPECEVMCVLDMNAGDVLVCPGGCHRAITVNTFVQLFKRQAPPAQRSGMGSGSASSSGLSMRRSGPVTPASPAPAALSQTVPKGKRPEDYGIFEKPKKGKNPLVGFRMWDILPESMPRLQSLSNAKGTAWEPMVAQIGTCNGVDPSEITDHVCPSWEHRCGVHAVKELAQVKKWGAPRVGNDSKYVRVIGEIDLWGRVLEYAEGFRAEWGYPKKLYVPDYLPSRFEVTPQELADMIWMAYLTEVEVNQDIYTTFDG